MSAISTVFDALEVHPDPSGTSQDVAEGMVALAQVAGMPVTWVSRTIVVLPDSPVESIRLAIEASE